MVIPNFVRSALDGNPINVYGTGEQTRCFGHVSDVIQGLIGLMEHPDAVGDVFNVGNDEETSIAEVAERVKEMTGSSSEIRYIPYEEAYGEGFEDMVRRVPNLAKIKKLIRYEPKLNLDDILASVIEYFRENSSER
jgi:UDP-glucose 4-epimerase